jgi:hypothetical protein
VPGEKPQVPPLRFAPVGMTILSRGQVFLAEALAGTKELSSRPEESWAFGPPKLMKNQLPFSNYSPGSTALPLVIPTVADPDFLLRTASNDHVCGSPQREPHAIHQRDGSRQEIRGSAVEGPAVRRLSLGKVFDRVSMGLRPT